MIFLIIRKWLFRRKVTKRKINYLIITYITGNIDHKIGYNRILLETNNFKGFKEEKN
jgi:hypothetical protein